MREHLWAYGFVGVMPLIVTLGTGGSDEVGTLGVSVLFLIYMQRTGYRAGKDSQERKARKAAAQGRGSSVTPGPPPGGQVPIR